MKKFEYYEVTCSLGKDIIHVANFEKLEDATLFCNSNTHYNYNISHQKTLVLCENQYEAVEYMKEVERQKVLAKLTRSERQILGLEE